MQGKVVAAVFIGDGEFRMEPPTSVEKHNLRIFVKEGKVAEPFTELVLHFTDDTYQEIARASSLTRAAPNSKALSILEARMMLMRRGKSFSTPNVADALLNYNLPARLLADIYDGSHAGFFNAFIKGTKFEHLMFRIDPRGAPFVEPEEVVLANFSDSDLGIWNSFHLKSHYDAGLSAAADEDHRLMDIQHQEINATIKGTELRQKRKRLSKSLSDGPRVLHFDLFPTLRVKRVADSTGRELRFIQEKLGEDPDLSVVFPEALRRGRADTLNSSIAGDKAMEQFGAGNFALVAREKWYPASSSATARTYDMTFRLREGTDDGRQRPTPRLQPNRQ